MSDDVQHFKDAIEAVASNLNAQGRAAAWTCLPHYVRGEKERAETDLYRIATSGRYQKSLWERLFDK